MRQSLVSKHFVVSKDDLVREGQSIRQRRLSIVEAALCQAFGDAVVTRFGKPWLRSPDGSDVNLRLVAASIVNDLKGA
jgi:hypothetical protein